MSFSLKPVIGALALTGMVSAQAVELQSDQARFSYALGFQFGQQLKSQGVKVDGAAFAAAVDDVLKGNQTQLTVQEMRAALQAGREALVKEKKARAQATLEAGEKFLAENGKREGVVSLPSGLQYQVITAGTGESPAQDAKVTVNYRGTLINGKEFDSSYKRGKPTTFSLGGVIPGFREGISKMKTGGKWKLFIPPAMGYGETGAGGTIGPNETLIFEVELISFEAAAAAQAPAAPAKSE